MMTDREISSLFEYQIGDLVTHVARPNLFSKKKAKPSVWLILGESERARSMVIGLQIELIAVDLTIHKKVVRFFPVFDDGYYYWDHWQVFRNGAKVFETIRKF